MGTNLAIWEHRIFLPFLFIFIFVLSLNCLSTKGVKNIYIFTTLQRRRVVLLLLSCSWRLKTRRLPLDSRARNLRRLNRSSFR